MTDGKLPAGGDPRQALTADQLAMVEAGEHALGEIRTRTVTHWLSAGCAWRALQEQAMYLSNSNQPGGRRYSETYSRLEQPWRELARIDRGTRKDAIWLFTNQALLLPALDKLGQERRDRMLHPTTIRKWARVEGLDPDFTVVTKPQGVDQRPTALQHAQQQLVDLRAELDAAEAEIRRLKRSSDNVSEGRDWTWQDSAADIAAVWFQQHPSKSLQIASKVLELGKTTTPKPRGKRQSEAKSERHSL
jgi:hypothetical protein